MAFGGFNTNALMPERLQTANPLEMAGQAISYKNALLGNKIQQAEYDARLAQGRALQGATDASGRTDYARARATMAADPAAAYGAAEAYSAQNRNRAEDVLNQEAQLSYQEHARNAAAGAFIRAAQNPTDANIQGAGAFIAHLTPGATDQIRTATRDLLSLPTAAQRSEAIKTLATSTLPGHDQISQAFGTPTMVDDGQTIQSGTQGAAMDGGAFTPTGGVQRQVSPEFNAHPVTVTGPDGTPRIVTQGSVVGTAKPTVPLDVMGSGRYPGGASDFSGPGMAAQPGGYVAGPPAGQVEAQRTTAEAGAKGANALMSAAASRNDRLGMLGNMATDLEGFWSGPGYDKARRVAQLFNVVSPIPVDSSGIEAAQSFNKWAQQLANAQSQALGSSDARLSAAEHANPNSSLQKETNQLMIHQLMGNEDAINAKAQAWRASGLPASQYQSWDQEFSQGFDPRAFQVLRMTPSEREKMFKGMRESGQMDEFKRSYNRMAAAGLVPSGR